MEIKVAPLLNNDLKKWSAKLNLYDESDARTHALIKFGRAGGQRTDTYVAAQVQHINCHLVKGKVVIVFTIVKDKILLSQPREQTIYGTGSIDNCPNLALLWYLSTKRKVFVREDFRDMIEHGDFKIKDECKTWPLFSCLNTDTDAVENDGLGKAMKLSASKLLAKRYTPRSLRSGCVCQFLLNSIKSKGTVDTNDYISIKTHIGWRDEKSILA